MDLSSFCSIHDKEGSFCKSTKNWKLDHKNMVKVLGFLLGFYTATVMKRWWSQISHMPLITDVSMVLNGMYVCKQLDNELFMSIKLLKVMEDKVVAKNMIFQF